MVLRCLVGKVVSFVFSGFGGFRIAIKTMVFTRLCAPSRHKAPWIAMVLSYVGFKVATKTRLIQAQKFVSPIQLRLFFHGVRFKVCSVAFSPLLERHIARLHARPCKYRWLSAWRASRPENCPIPVDAILQGYFWFPATFRSPPPLSSTVLYMYMNALYNNRLFHSPGSLWEDICGESVSSMMCWQFWWTSKIRVLSTYS